MMVSTIVWYIRDMISIRLGKFQTPLLLLFSTWAVLFTLHSPCETSANTVLLFLSTLLLSAKLGSVRPCFGNLKLVLDSTLWSYKLILKHLPNYRTKFYYIDFVWPLTPSSLMDIWYLVSNKQEICQKSWKMACRKKVRFLGLAQIYPFSDEGFFKYIWYFC